MLKGQPMVEQQYLGQAGEASDEAIAARWLGRGKVRVEAFKSA